MLRIGARPVSARGKVWVETAVPEPVEFAGWVAHNVVGPLRPGSGHYVPGMYLAIMGPRLRTLINKF